MMTFHLEQVSVRHIGAAQSSFALRDLSLSIQHGEQVTLIGPSGAGKTSLLHTLACALKPVQGGFQVFGLQPWSLPNTERHKMRARLFLAPQTPPLPPRQRVVNAVLAGALPRWSTWKALCSLIKPQGADVAYQALIPFHLQDKLYMRVDRLSGGERQRCGMARALVSHAEAFLIDEPLSALDPALALQTLTALQSEARHRNATLVCSLHQVELALAHFPRVVGLRDGRIIFDALRTEVTTDMITALYRSTDQHTAGLEGGSPAPVDAALVSLC